MNPASRKADQRLSDFPNCIGAAANATLDTEQPISHTTSAFVYTITSLQDSDGQIIPGSEVHEMPKLMTF